MRRICLILPLFAFVSCAFESTMVITGYERQPLFAESTVQLTSNLPNAQWYSSNPEVAIVDETGLVSITDSGDMLVVYITAISGGHGAEIAITVTPNFMISQTLKFLYAIQPYANKLGYVSFGADGSGSIWFKDASPYETPAPFSFNYWFEEDKMFTDQQDRLIGIQPISNGSPVITWKYSNGMIHRLEWGNFLFFELSENNIW